MDILHSVNNIVLAVLPLWVTVLNPVAFLLFGLDKLFAKRNKRRIRERTLFLLSKCIDSMRLCAFSIVPERILASITISSLNPIL